MTRSLNSVESLFHYDSKIKFSRGRLYTIKKGDTLSQLAKLEYGNGNFWPYIWVNNLNFCSANKVGILSPLLLSPGKEIYLPHKNDVLKWYSKEDTNELYFVTQLEKIMPLYYSRSSLEQERFPDLFKCNSKVIPAIHSRNEDISEKKVATQASSLTISLVEKNLNFPRLLSTKYLAFGTKVGFTKGKISYKPVSEMAEIIDTSISTEKKLKKAYSNKEFNQEIFNYLIKSIEVSYELSDQLAIALKINDTTFTLASKSGISFKQEGEIAKQDLKSDTEKEKVIGGGNVKWDFSVDKDCITISLKASIHTRMFSKVFKKGEKVGNFVFLEDCEYALCFEDIEAVISCFMKVRDKKVLDALKKLLDYLKKGKKLYGKAEKAAKYLLSVIIEIWERIRRHKNNGDKGDKGGGTVSSSNAVESATSIVSQKKKLSEIIKKARKEKKKTKNTAPSNAYADLTSDEDIEIDFSDDVIELIPPEGSTEGVSTVAHIDEEFSKNFTKLLKRMQYLNSAQNMDVAKIRKVVSIIEEEQIKNDIIKNRGIPTSYRFLDAFAAHGIANSRPAANKSDMFFSLDPKTGLQNLSTYLVVGGLIVVTAIAIVYTLPVIIPALAAAGTAVAAGAGKAGVVITISGSYALSFR